MNKRGIPILIIAALLLLAGGVIWAANAGGSEDSTSGIQAEASATVAVTPQSTALPTATEQPPPTDPPPTATPQPPPTDVPPAPTPDTRVPMGEIPAADQIQLGKDGKYFVADRGDGCTWTEALRFADSKLGEIIVLRTDCPVNFQYDFRPETGDVAVSIS